MQPLPLCIFHRNPPTFAHFIYNQPRIRACQTAHLHKSASLFHLQCSMECNQQNHMHIIFFYFDTFSLCFLFYHPLQSLYLWPNPTTCALGSGLAALRGVLLPLQMGGERERGDITGTSFEMVRSSVYSAAQMKVSREEMHKVEGGRFGGGVGGRRTSVRKGGRGGLFLLQATHLHYSHSILEGFILPFGFASFYLSLFLHRSFDQG